MKNIIYLLGVDGSGKTTLAQNIIRRLKHEEIDCKYLYARYIPILTRPIKILSQILLYKKTSEFLNYNKYNQIKTNFSERHKIFARFYAYLCLIDYIIFSGPVIIVKIMTSQSIIVDRYIGDIITTISLAANLNTKEFYLLIKLMHLIFPKPTIALFIDVKEEIAYQRKNDIQSIEYLRERKEKYYLLKDFYNYKILDGHQTKEQLLYDALQVLKDNI